MIQFLQFTDRYLVHLGDGGERFSLGHDVCAPVRHSSGGGNRGLSRVRHRGRGTGTRVLNFLLQAQDLLGKQVDLDVLLIDLARED